MAGEKQRLLNGLSIDGIVTSDQIGNLVGSVTSMPTASADLVGVAVLYTGASDSTYVNNTFYVCVEDSSSYTWVTASETAVTISQTSSGISINGTALQNASGSQPGLLTNTAQTIGGDKTLTGSLTLTGTNGITSNNIIFNDWKLGVARNASGQLYRFVGLDVNDTTGWLKTRSASDVITDLGIVTTTGNQTVAGDKTFSGATKLAQTLGFTNTSNPYISMTTNNIVQYIQAYQGSLYLGTGTSSGLAIDNSGNVTLTNSPTSNASATTKQYVDNAISSNTATFRGTYGAVADLSFSQTTVDAWTNPPTSTVESNVASAIATKLSALSITPTNNDYVFVTVDQTPVGDVSEDWYWRFKYNGSSWAYEYSLNNTGFTTAQWNAINSGITSSLVSKLNNIGFTDVSLIEVD